MKELGVTSGTKNFRALCAHMHISLYSYNLPPISEILPTPLRAAGQRSKLGLPAAAWLRQTSEIRELLLSTDAFQKEAILF